MEDAKRLAVGVLVQAIIDYHEQPNIQVNVKQLKKTGVKKTYTYDTNKQVRQDAQRFIDSNELDNFIELWHLDINPSFLRKWVKSANPEISGFWREDVINACIMMESLRQEEIAA